MLHASTHFPRHAHLHALRQHRQARVLDGANIPNRHICPTGLCVVPPRLVCRQAVIEGLALRSDEFGIVRVIGTPGRRGTTEQGIHKENAAQDKPRGY